MKLLIVHDADGNSLDENDTLDQVGFVIRSLTEDWQYKVYKADYRNLSDLEDTLLTFAPDLVFNLVENKCLHIIPSFLETLKVPYTGNSAMSLYLTTDKLLFKQLMPKKTVAPCVSLTSGRAKKGSRYIIKPVSDDASIGITADSVFFAENTEDIKKRLKKCDMPSFAELYIEGREVNVAVLPDRNGKLEIFSPREVHFKNFTSDRPKILDYKAKWCEDSFEYKNTETITNKMTDEPELLEKIRKYVLICFKRFNLKGYARVDFRIDSAGRPYVLEVNANPCISPHGSGFYRSFTECGYNDVDLIRRIIDAV